MSANDSLERELKQFVIETLALEEIEPQDIDSQSPLFGEGLGLDSVDALELGVALQKKYGVAIDADSEETRQHFASIHNLTDFVATNRNT